MTAKKKERKPAPLKGGHKKHFEARSEIRAGQQKLAEKYQDNEPVRYEGEYTERLGEFIADLVVEGIILDNIEKLPNMPPRKVMLRWIRSADHPFSKLYYDARAAMAPLYEERALAEAMDPLVGIKKTTIRRGYVDAKGEVHEIEESNIVEGDNVERSKLRIAAYQWALGYLDRQRHGPRAADGDKQPNDQLKAMFESLKAGPVDGPTLESAP